MAFFLNGAEEEDSEEERFRVPDLEMASTTYREKPFQPERNLNMT
jgi:hypothetical protein